MLRAVNGTRGECEGEALSAGCDGRRWCQKLRVRTQPVAFA